MKILLIEDDMDLGNGGSALRDQGMQVVWVRSLEDAARSIEHDSCELVLLDLGLPDGDGLDLPWLRAARLPVLILSARDTLEQRLRGPRWRCRRLPGEALRAGRAAVARACLARRSYGFDGDTIELRGLLLRVPTRRVSVHGRPVELTASEYALLKTLLMRANRVITRRVAGEHILPGGLRPMPVIHWMCIWVTCAAR